MTNLTTATEAQVFTDIRSFLLAWVPAGVEVVRGQTNQVAPPESETYVLMVIDDLKSRATPVVTSPTDGVTESQTLTQSQSQGVSLEIFGSQSADIVKTLVALFRSPWAADYFAAQPAALSLLEVDNPRQNPFSDGEKQYEQHWTLFVNFGLSAALSTAMQFADSLTATINQADSN